ncbi:MAG: helix-turn-helix domain-containing protein [Mucilaginibacter polytrichastri]|nr:helix-turn-helix domain-containing protein [Mucilaginibacter polytrichastri]
MDTQLERVQIDPGKSFRLFTPRLKNFFYWHYHPEIELVYVEATAGIRHVGQHVSDYVESDLVLIGPNIPHLNFDYGLKTEYRQIVIQLKQDFLGDAFAHTPELTVIRHLFGRAAMGVSFHGETKTGATEMLTRMQHLKGFDQLMCLMDILNLLAMSNEYTLLNTVDTSVRSFRRDKVRISSVYEYIHAKYNQHPDVHEIAGRVHLSTAAFCRYFKKQTRLTFTEFVNQYRINQAKTLLLHDQPIAETAYAVGFENVPHFNKVFRKMTGENPSAFRKRYRI